MSMTNEERSEYAKRLFDECLKILDTKGIDYSGKDDCTSNFKRNAANLGLTKYQVWSVYFLKHVDSVMNAIKRNPEAPIGAGEALRERIHDIINYAVILGTLLEEDKATTARE